MVAVDTRIHSQVDNGGPYTSLHFGDKHQRQYSDNQ